VLNDNSCYERFAAVNAAFRPDVVVFNNSHWKPEDFRKLDADSFHVLPGAVDTTLYSPASDRAVPLNESQWNIGALAAKEIAPLLNALTLLPPSFHLHLYGIALPEHGRKIEQLVKMRRVTLHGALMGEKLAAFYRNMDIVVAAEMRAGWCNTAAEAFACGIPCIVSRAGTVDFARHEENCLIIDRVTPETIASAVNKMANDPGAAKLLGKRAPAAVQRFSWQKYADKLLPLIEKPVFRHYYRAPDIGLFGKWEETTRFAGIDSMPAESGKKASVLDLGCAEGLASYTLASNGCIGSVHGFEYNSGRASFAHNLHAGIPETDSTFRQADISDWKLFRSKNKDLLQSTYDIVLFLGLYHNLPVETRKSVLKEALRMSKKQFLIRTSSRIKDDDQLDSFIREQGFASQRQEEQACEESVGWLGVYKRL